MVTKYQKFAWADKFGTGLVTIADIADAAIHNKHYDPYWAHPFYSSSPATCSATGGPGTGTFQCVDIGDISTIALYKGVGATDPIPLAQYVGLDPHLNRFAASNYPASSMILAAAVDATTNNLAVTEAVGTTVTVASMTATADVGGVVHAQTVVCAAGAACVNAGISPGVNKWNLAFAVPPAGAPCDIEITVVFSNGASIQVEFLNGCR
jgi:hypothetical protein